MGTVLGLIALAVALLLAEVMVSCLARAAAVRSGRGSAPDHPLTLAGFSGSFLLAVLAVTSAHPLLAAVAAAAVFAVTAAPLANLMRIAAKQGKTGIALQRIGRMLRIMFQDARYLPLRDLRALLGLLRRDPVPAAESGGYRPVPGGRMRAVPSVMKDVALGPVPHPASVAADLERQGVAVPPVWAAVAEAEGAFEAGDEDDWLNHWAEIAAGVLTAAEAFQASAETAGTLTGLDPDVLAALWEFADIFADVAPAAMMVVRRYYDTYEGVHEHRDAGKTLMRDADKFLGAEADPDGGQAA